MENIRKFTLGAAICAVFLLVVAPCFAGNGIVVAGNARFTVVTANCIRMEYSETGKFVDAPSMFAANRAARFTGYKLTRSRHTLTIDTGAIKLRYSADGKRFSPGNLRGVIKCGSGTVTWKPGQENSGNLGGTATTLDGWSGPGELPKGIISRDGWYVLDDSRGDLLTSDWVQARPDNLGTDWYLFGYGRDYKTALKSLTTVGGAIPMPRKYSLGVWYSRYWPYTSKEFRQIVEEYTQHGFPLDVIVLDMDWHKDGWTGWSWNRDLLPDAEDLLKWFHQQGLASTLNLHPSGGVAAHEDMYETFTRDMGVDPATRQTVEFDAANKRYVDTLFKDVITPHEKEGVDFWWLDWQQQRFTKSIPDLTNLAWLNRCFYTHTAADGKRGISFSRWAGWGDHRYPIHFSGDASTDWSMLSFEVPFTSTAGNVGCFFWSHDIGGHMGPRNEESYVRWCQFGAASAVLRSHSSRSAENDRRPWKFPKWAEDSMRVSFQLRSKIFPYVYSCAAQSCRESVPLTRPMYIEYPNSEEAYHNGQQYLLGDRVLVAPVAEPGTGPSRIGRQVVWFPKGEWYDYFTGEKFTGHARS